MKHRKERSAGRPSRPAASRGRGKPKNNKNSNNNSDPQRKPVQAAGGAGGAGRDPAAGQEDAAHGPARPGAQRPARGGAAAAAPRPGPRARPHRPPRLRERRGGHGDGGGSRFAPAGGRRLSGGRAQRPGPGGGVAVSAEGNGARGAKVLEEKKEKQARAGSPGGYRVAPGPRCARPARMGAAGPGRRP